MHVLSTRHAAQAEGRSRAASIAPSARAETRLLEAVLDVCLQCGYSALTVERLLAAADVSRATFYQYFANIDDCFWASHRRHTGRLIGESLSAAPDRGAGEIARLEGLVTASLAVPALVQFVVREALATGHPGLDHYDALLDSVACEIGNSGMAASSFAVPRKLLIGGIARFMILSADHQQPARLPQQVREWLRVFQCSSPDAAFGERLAAARSAPRVTLADHARANRTGSPRERMLRATAEIGREQGFRDSTVAHIARAAGVSRRQYYNHFASKADAFQAAYRYAFERTVAACAPAFFGPGEWPDRVWRGLGAFTGFLSREPALADLGFVQFYALGPSFAPYAHDAQLAFTLFLEDGYRQRAGGPEPPRIFSTLVASTVFEACFQACRRGPGLHLRTLQPLACFIALAPFVGRDRAARFVSAKLNGSRDVPR